ncbi:MAG: MBL fold metallo-hydrolase [Thermoanaerobaculia bacterium]
MQLPLIFDERPLRLCVLGSGSSGNAVVVESGGRRLLLDAGFSCRQIEKRLRAVGLEAEDFVGLVVTHEHSDHCKGAQRFARRHGVPVWGTRGTLEATGLAAADDLDLRVLSSSRPVALGDFLVTPFIVPHDAREPVGLVVEDRSGRRAGLAGDLGTASRLAWAHLAELDVLILETNHDLEMLRSGPYPWPLKQRVAARHGHLSNREAAEGLPELLADRLRHVVLYHLSRTNNRPSIALAEIGEVLAREGSRAQVHLTRQDAPGQWIEIA